MLKFLGVFLFGSGRQIGTYLGTQGTYTLKLLFLKLLFRTPDLGAPQRILAKQAEYCFGGTVSEERTH